MVNLFVFQCLTVLVLLESSLFLLFRAYTQSELIIHRSKLCGRCRINVKVENDIRNVNSSVVLISRGKKFIRASQEDVVVDLNHIKKSVKNVFFIESSCGTRKLAEEHISSNYLLSARQSCAVESTSRINPDRDIYIVHSCPFDQNFLSRAPEYARKLLQLQNVHMVRVNLTELFLDSPVQQLFESGSIDASEWPVVHASDVIRILLLWKFGGTYCDLDIINIKPLDSLGTNFAGFQDRTVNNAFLNFEPDGFGHYVCTKVLQHLETSFDGSVWAINGPFALTQVIIEEECKIPPMAESDCNAFTIYDRSILYPIFFPAFGRLFDTSSSVELIKQLKDTAYSVHFWNKQSKNVVVDVGSNQTYGKLADEFCPAVYSNCGPIF